MHPHPENLPPIDSVKRPVKPEYAHQRATFLMWAIFMCLCAAAVIYVLIPIDHSPPPGINTHTLELLNAVTFSLVTALSFLAGAIQPFQHDTADAALRAWKRANLLFWAGCMTVLMLACISKTRSSPTLTYTSICWSVLILVGATLPTRRRLNAILHPASGVRSRPRALLITALLVTSTACLWALRASAGATPTKVPPEAFIVQPINFIPLDHWPAGLLKTVKAITSRGKDEEMTVKVFGLQQGVEAPDGWSVITSSGAGFRIVMPGPSLDFRLVMPTPEGVAVAIDAVQVREGDIVWRASCTRRGDGNPVDTVEHLLAPYQAHPKTSRIQPILVDGRPGFEIQSTSAKGLTRFRLVTDHGTVWNWGVELPDRQSDETITTLNRFLNSFHFE